MGSYRERNQQKRNRNVRRDSCRDTGKLDAKAGPRPTLTLTLSLVSIPYRERKWIDIEPGKFSQRCFEVSKVMIRLLRHDDSVHREEDGAVRFDDLAELFRSRFAATSHWSSQPRISFLEKGEGQKKRFQYCLNPHSSEHFLVFPSNPRTFRCTLVDPTFQDNVLLPDDFAEYIYHIGNAHDMHSIIQCGLVRKEKVVRVLHSREPDVHPSESRRSSLRSG